MSLFDSASVIITPNAYKEDKLYSIKPTDGSGDLVVTRATTATRVNSAGLVELVPVNLFTYSEQFDNAAWSKYQATVTANDTTAPNGTLTADKLASSTSATAVLYRTAATEANAATISVYAKAGTNDILDIGFTNVSDYTVKANLTTGTITSATSGITGTITSVGNGWYRVTATRTMTASGTGFINNANTVSGRYIHIWGAQLVTGSSAKEYFPTTTRLNMPRIDYTNGSCPSILVEPQRTNLQTYSEDFSNAVYIKVGATVSTNIGTAPDGNTTADKLTEDTSTGLHTAAIVASQATGGDYTFSVFVKANGRTKFQLSEAFSIGGNVTFNLTAGTATTTAPAKNGKIENYGNGWYKCSATWTFTGGATTVLYLNLLNDSGASTYTGNGTGGVNLWGAQLEAGSYNTSYIPTVASSVTRNADVISKTGISSLIGQTEGTIFVEHIYNTETINNTGVDDIVIGFSNGTLNNLLLIIHYGSGNGNPFNNKLRLYIRNAGADQALIDLAGTTTGTYKIAVAYKNNDVAFYVNGVQVGIDTSVSVPTLSALYLYDFLSTNTKYNTDKVKSAAIWKTRLDNATLAQLTTI